MHDAASIWIAVMLAFSLVTTGRADTERTFNPGELVQNFQSPPDTAQCFTFWHFNKNSSDTHAITRDLQSMREQGIKGAVLFPFGQPPPNFEHVLREADRLGMEILLNHDSSWSATLPYMTEELAKKRLVFSEQVFDGGAWIGQALTPPVKTGFYRDIAVLASRLGELGSQPVKVASDKPVAQATTRVSLPDGLEVFYGRTPSARDVGNVTMLHLMVDGGEGRPPASELDLKTARRLVQSGPPGSFDVYYHDDPSADSSFLQPSDILDISNQMSSDGNLGWQAPPGRWLILRFGYTVSNKSFPDFFNREAVDHHLRMGVEKLLPVAGKYIGKSWTHMFQDSFENGSPTWTQKFREEFRARRGYDMTPWMPVLADHLVGSRALSDRFLHDYRQTISDLYVDNWFGYFAKRLKGMGLKYATEAAYGCGSPVADAMKIFSCSETPVGEFWHTQRHPITGKQPTGGHSGVDSNSPGFERAETSVLGFGFNAVRLAASATHIYGKPFARAEAFTTWLHNKEGDYALYDPPFAIKSTADRAFCDGLGQIIFHVYSQQDDSDEMPGNVVWENIGLHFNRKITWWSRAHVFTEYLSRCQLLLRQGKFVADFAYWTGDTVPYEYPDRVAMRPALPPGCNADLVNTDVLINRMSVKDGLLVLPDGVFYRYLVMPPKRDTMEAASLRKIRDLIETGATVVLGPRPVSAAGLGNYPKCDDEVKGLADAIWGAAEVTGSGERKLGKGRVVWGRPLVDLLAADKLAQDVAFEGGKVQPDFDWIHYRTSKSDIYFVSNQTSESKTNEVRFRLTAGPGAHRRQPELWDPVGGTHRLLPEFRQSEDGTIALALQFAPRQSYFIVFRETGSASTVRVSGTNFPELKTALELAGPWEVQFDQKWFYPDEGKAGKVIFEKLEDWTQRPEEAVKYFSGTATYRKRFAFPGKSSKPSRLWLDLGTVKDLAEVRLNGKSLGVVWTAPWRVEISEALKEVENVLEIDVVNQWPNRLIGDSRLPADKQVTKSNYKLKPGDPLVSSGLLGPVQVMTEE